MSTFDDWERQALADIADVEAGLVAIQAKLAQQQSAAGSLVTSATAMEILCSQTAGPTSPLGQTWGSIADCNRKVDQDTHDVQLVITADNLARRIDLSTLVRPIHYSPSGGNIIDVIQRTTAVVHLSAYDGCHTIFEDQFGIEIPIRIQALGDTTDVSLCVTLALARSSIQSVSENRFDVELARGLSICPSGALDPTLARRFLDDALTQVSMQLPWVVDLNAEGMGSVGIPTFFYGVRVDNYISFFGRALQQHVAPVALMGPLPAWSELGVKLALDIIRGQIDLAASTQGAVVEAISADPGQHAVFARLRSHEHGERSGLGFKIVVDVYVRLTLGCTFQPGGVGALTFHAEQIGGFDVEPHTDVQFAGKTLPGVSDLANEITRIVADRATAKLQRVVFNQPISIPSATRLEGDVEADGIVLYAATA